MSRIDFKLKLATQQAERFLEEERITSLPVDPKAIAKSRDIVVQAMPENDPGVSGMLLRHDMNFGILYATHIPIEGFQRFSIAHELGHYFLDGHIDHLFNGSDFHASQAGFVSQDPYEREADHFATGLLMPEKLFRRAMGRYDDGLGAIERLANDCSTSLTATAIRYAHLTECAAAVVVSTGPTIDYCFMSDVLKGMRGLTWLAKGTPLPATSATLRFNRDPEKVSRATREAGESDIADWFGGSCSIEAVEEVIGLGRYGKTLTVITCAERIPDEDEEDEDEDLVERWIPRLGRR